MRRLTLAVATFLALAPLNLGAQHLVSEGDWIRARIGLAGGACDEITD